MRYSRVYNLLPVLVVSSALFLFISCENKVTAPERIVNKPGPVQAVGNNDSITIKFYGNNIEEGFKGYNVYVSTLPDISSQMLSPVVNSYGTFPTLLYGSTGCFPNASAKSFITVSRDSASAPINANTTYYVAVSAYLLIGEKEYNSPLTEDVAVAVKVKGSTNLQNQKIIGKSGDGIIFNNDGQITMTNVADNYLMNGTGDLFFKIENTSGTFTPVLSVQSNDSSLQDGGYVANIDDYVNIPSAGYINNYFIPAIAGHVYILYKPSINKYVKIYITQIDGSSTSETSDVKLWFEYSY